MIFELPLLPYQLNALEPYISEQTMSYHYGKHHKAYIDNLNKYDKLAYIDTKQDLLQPVFVDGKLIKEMTLEEIRKKLLNANSTKD